MSCYCRPILMVQKTIRCVNGIKGKTLSWTWSMFHEKKATVCTNLKPTLWNWHGHGSNRRRYGGFRILFQSQFTWRILFFRSPAGWANGILVVAVIPDPKEPCSLPQVAHLGGCKETRSVTSRRRPLLTDAVADETMILTTGPRGSVRSTTPSNHRGLI